MQWTPLITASAFTGIQTDLITTAGGVVSIRLDSVRPALKVLSGKKAHFTAHGQENEKKAELKIVG